MFIKLQRLNQKQKFILLLQCYFKLMISIYKFKFKFKFKFYILHSTFYILHSTLYIAHALFQKKSQRKNLRPVPTKGIEPSRPCERQILSLLRLPIPPHGQLLNWAAILHYPPNLSKIRCRYFFL